MNNRKNFFSALVYQSIHIVYGLVVPRIIILYFGSEVNGLISSINQFLSYISLIEGGITGVIIANLYKPIINKDNEKISLIYSTTKRFYKKI